jgi:hypothetical protein
MTDYRVVETCNFARNRADEKWVSPCVSREEALRIANERNDSQSEYYWHMYGSRWWKVEPANYVLRSGLDQ